MGMAVGAVAAEMAAAPEGPGLCLVLARVFVYILLHPYSGPVR